MIAVDTSVWIVFFRGKDPAVTARLQDLLRRDAVVLPVPVRIELLGGLGRQDRARLKKLLDAVPPVRPTAETWTLIETWVERAWASGDHFGMGDLLIAALAAEGKHALWSLDGDFARMAALGFITPYAGS